MLLKPKKNIVVVVDIGSAKIAALLAKIYDNSISIIGCACKPSQGIKNGIIIDIRKSMNVVASVIEELENMCGENIESVYLNVSGCNLGSYNKSFDILTGNGEISEKEIKTILDKGYEEFKENDRVSVLHCLPIEYKLDGTPGIVNPYGMYGNCLSVRLHMVTACKSLLINMASCFSRCHLSIAGYIAETYADGFACISNDDKNLGVTIVNIGGGVTSIGVYKDNNFIHIDTIPIGGINITKDIACAFSLSIDVAEKIKTQHATLFPISDYNEILDYEELINKDSSNETIDELIPISKFDLNDVISARVDEIIEMIDERLFKIKNNIQVLRKIVLVGGSSKIDGIRERFVKKFNTTVVYGKQNKLFYSDIDITDPSFSSLVGSILLLNEYFYSQNNEQSSMVKTVQTKGNFVKWIQKHF